MKLMSCFSAYSIILNIAFRTSRCHFLNYSTKLNRIPSCARDSNIHNSNNATGSSIIHSHIYTQGHTHNHSMKISQGVHWRRFAGVSMSEMNGRESPSEAILFFFISDEWR